MMHAEAKAVVDSSRGKAALQYDKRCKLLKRSYSLMRARDKMRLKIRSLIKIQREVKRWYQRL